MDSEPPPLPNAFLSSPITQFLKDRTTETQPTSFPASFQTSHTSSSVFAATSPTFLSALSDLQDEEFVDYLLSSTASENLLTAPVAKKVRKFAPPKSSKEVEQAKQYQRKHSLTSSIAYYYVLLLWLLSYLDQIFAT